MSNEINPERRRFLTTSAITIAGAQFGMIDFAKSQSNPIKQSTSKSFGAMKQIAAGLNDQTGECHPSNNWSRHGRGYGACREAAGRGALGSEFSL